MSAKSHVWWWSAKRSWASQVDGKRALLAKGRKNKKVAEEKLCKILAERQLLSTVDGPISVASLLVSVNNFLQILRKLWLLQRTPPTDTPASCW